MKGGPEVRGGVGRGRGQGEWGQLSQDEALGPGFPLKIDGNRSKAGLENSLLVSRR